MSSIALQIESWAVRMTFSNLPLMLCPDRSGRRGYDQVHDRQA